MKYRTKLNIRELACTNCGQYKITKASWILYIMAGLLFIFIITWPLAVLCLFFGIIVDLSRKKTLQKYFCANCQKKFTRQDIENINFKPQ